MSVLLLAPSCSTFLTKNDLLTVSWLIVKASDLCICTALTPASHDLWVIGTARNIFPLLCVCAYRGNWEMKASSAFPRNLLGCLSIMIQICHFPPGSLHVVLSLIPIAVLPSSLWTGDVTLLVYSEVRSWWHISTASYMTRRESVFSYRCALYLHHKSSLWTRWQMLWHWHSRGCFEAGCSAYETFPRCLIIVCFALHLPLHNLQNKTPWHTRLVGNLLCAEEKALCFLTHSPLHLICRHRLMFAIKGHI